VQEFVDDVKEEVHEKVEDVQEIVAEVKEDVQEFADNLKESALDKFDDVQEFFGIIPNNNEDDNDNTNKIFNLGSLIESDDNNDINNQDLNNSPGLKREKGTVNLTKNDSNFTMDSMQLIQNTTTNNKVNDSLNDSMKLKQNNEFDIEDEDFENGIDDNNKNKDFSMNMHGDDNKSDNMQFEDLQEDDQINRIKGGNNSIVTNEKVDSKIDIGNDNVDDDN